MAIGVKLGDKSRVSIAQEFIELIKESNKEANAEKGETRQTLQPNSTSKAYMFNFHSSAPFTLGSVPKLRLEVTLGWLGFKEYAARIEAVADKLNKQYPGVDIEVDIAKVVDLNVREAGPLVEPD